VFVASPYLGKNLSDLQRPPEMDLELLQPTHSGRFHLHFSCPGMHFISFQRFSGECVSDQAQFGRGRGTAKDGKGAGSALDI